MKKNKLNTAFKLLLVFIATIVLFHFILWKFISTDTFGRHLSAFLNGYLSKYTQVEIRYDKLEAKLFPPGITIFNVQIKTLSPFGDLRSLTAQIGQLDVDAKVFTVSWDMLKISNIELKNVVVNADISPDVFNQKKPSTDPWKNWKFDYLKNLMSFGILEVLRVGVENAQVNTNLASGEIQKFSWEKLYEKIETSLDLKKISVNNEIFEKAIGNKKLGEYLCKLEYFKNDLYITKKEIGIYNFNTEYLGQTATLRGEVKNPFNKNQIVLNLELLANIHHDGKVKNNDFPWQAELVKNGINAFHSKSKIKITGGLEQINLDAYSDIEGVKSSYCNIDFATIEWQLGKNILEVKNILAKDNTGGLVKSQKSNIKFDLEKVKLKEFDAAFDVTSVDLSNALGFLPSVSKSLGGKATGGIKVQRDSESGKIDIDSIDKILVQKFLLQTNKNKELLQLESLMLHEMNFGIGNEVSLSGKATVVNNEVEYQGKISKENISIKTSNFTLNLDEIKNIAGIKTEGLGQARIEVEGELKNPKLIFNLQNVEHANVFGFYLGTLSGNLTIDFIRDAIFLENIQSTLNPGKLKGDGYISLNDFTTDLSIQTTDLSTIDLLMMHKILLPWNLSYLEKVISTSNVNYKISGKINSLKDLVVKVDLKTQRITYGSEEIYDIVATLLFKNKIITVPNIDFKKGKGKLTLGLTYDLNEDVFRLAFKSKNLEATDLLLYKQVNPSFSSSIELEGAYKSTKNSNDGVLNVLATDSRLNGEYIDDSYFAIQWKDGVAKAQGKYANNWIKLNSVIDFNQTENDQAHKSFITASINVPDWGKFFNLFASFDNDDPVLAGKLNLELDTLFNIKKPRAADIDFWIKDLTLTHPSLQIKKTNNDRITIEKGEIKKWDIVVKGQSRDQFISRAYGNISKQAEIENVFDFSLGKLNYFLGSYLDLNGFVQSQLKVKINSKEDISYLGRVKSDDMILNSKELVSSLGTTRLLLEFDNKEIRLVQLLSQMGVGTFNMTGNVNWQNLYPAMTFRYSFNNAKIQVASRTMGVLGGQGLIVGTQPPYIISGDLRLLQAELLNEFGDFSFAKGKRQNTVKYLPSQTGSSKADLFLLNTTLVTENPVVVRNSMAELYLTANGNLTGKISDPRVTGHVNLKNDRRNIFILKNNNFKINRLNVLFDNRQPISNPSLDIDAESNISTYVVRAKIYGAVKDYQLDLSSDPALSRQSILSLIAFGYAENLSENMSNADREALSSAGLGAFIFDQLKLNERLHSNLGLTLNVGTEYLSSTSSLLQGRTQQSSNSVGQVRTATKLELRKKIDEHVGVSVSSTVGGSAGQKQSMNLNYMVNKNVSLDAIYELNTDVTEGQERAGSSGGGDIKFKWTFK